MSNLDVCKEMEQNFINYAYAVNSDRSIPAVADGLKPVARRILWDMYIQKNFSNKSYVKCATVVGDTMGQFHPHGDSSIYGAMTRLAQEWIMRYPLIDWHGNKGGITGDGAAAYRYTECRLEKISEIGFLNNLNKDVVEMQPNYSETAEEPALLPAIFPNILCNPNEGIGLAMACNWLPHNLNEIAQVICGYIKNGEIDDSHLYPDFPGGGTIINKADINSIYKTGKGRVIVEANYIEEQRNGKKLLVFTELPYQVFTEDLLDQINNAYEANKIQNITDVRDESGKQGLRVVVELASNANKNKVLTQLYQETSLRKNFNANNVALIGKTPTLLTLQKVIDIYVSHNMSCIKREYQYDYDKAMVRLNIIEGLLIAITNIDEVIEIIRCDTNPKETLKITFDLNDEQVQAILDMKLGRLSKLEKEKLENELQEKKELIELCLSVINNEDKQKEILIERLRDLVNKYGDERRTKVIQKEIVKVAGKAKQAQEIIPEDVVITLNNNGYIKSIPITSFKISKRGGAGTASDTVIDTIKTNTTDTLILLSTLGKMYRISANDIAQCDMKDKGTAVGSLLKLAPQEKIVRLLSNTQDNGYDYVLFTTQKGLVKKTARTEFAGTTRNLNGVKAITIKDGDILQSVQFINNEDIILFTYSGQCLRFDSSLITPTGKSASGVKGINLNANDYVVASVIVQSTSTHILIVTEDGYGKRVPLISFNTQGRGGKGNKCGTNIVGATVIDEQDKVVVFTNSKNITIIGKSVPEVSKSAIGNKLIKSGKIINICKL